MASHGSKRHLKRLAKPVIIPISSKGSRYLKKGTPSGHLELEAAPLLVLVRDVMKITSSARQARKLLSAGEIKVDGRIIGDPGFTVGLMDVISIPKEGKFLRVVNNKGKLALQKISEEESKTKICKVSNKHVTGKGKIQLNLHDGRNLLIEKEEDRFKTGDTVKISIPGQKMQGFLKFEKGATCYVYRGKHAGQVALLDELKQRAGSKPTEAVLSREGEKFITLKGYLFVVDKGFQTA